MVPLRMEGNAAMKWIVGAVLIAGLAFVAVEIKSFVGLLMFMNGWG
jgi:hypothetical protein